MTSGLENLERGFHNLTTNRARLVGAAHPAPVAGDLVPAGKEHNLLRETTQETATVPKAERYV